MKVEIQKKYQKEIDDIWDNRLFAEISVIDRGYAISDNVEKKSLLFLGINPSYSGENKSRHFYTLSQRENEYKRYFSKFEEISKDVDLIWSHIDLLFLRETKQKFIDEIIRKETNGLEFIWQQLQVSKKILEEINPKIIVVSNTKARQFLGKEKKNGKNIWLGYDFEFNDNIGTYQIKSKDSNLYNTPVFFSSMLTGQRALDNGSFERLKWHIKRTLKNHR